MKIFTDQLSRRKFVKLTSWTAASALLALQLPFLRRVSAFTTSNRMFAPEKWANRKISTTENSTAPEVREIQIRIAGFVEMHAKQVFLKTTGIFDEQTKATLQRFQYAYGLPATGEFTEKEAQILNSLEKDDGSTLHTNWKDFASSDTKTFEGGTEVHPAIVQENCRRMMWRVEAMNRKLWNAGIQAKDQKLTVRSGFRSIKRNNEINGKVNSYHTYGVACDVYNRNIDSARIYAMAKTCGFSGIIHYPKEYRDPAFVHCDIRMEVYPDHFDRKWLWSDVPVSESGQQDGTSD